MARVLAQVKGQPPLEVARAVDDDPLDQVVAEILRVRGISGPRLTMDQLETQGPPMLCAMARAQPLSLELAAELAPLCSRAAARERPLVMLVSLSSSDHERQDHAAARAYLRSHGAILHDDPDAWIENLVLLAGVGVPAGRRIALVAPPGTWLAASAAALAAEMSAAGRSHILYDGVDRIGPADAVLIERSELARTPLPASSQALMVPVVGRAESLGDQPALVGLRAALTATRATGGFAERRATGFGPAPALQPGDLKVDRERLSRQLQKVRKRAGDHETKVMLSAFGVPVTRQAVATTPSAATRLAKRAGFPVELKLWGPDVPGERDGCAVERDIQTAAEVRRAYAKLTEGTSVDASPAVIVREQPMTGREARVIIARKPAVGLTVVIEVDGLALPAAAPAPLRRIDADELAQVVEASRAGDAEPDRAALADLLLRASHLIASEPRIAVLEMGRILVGPRGQGAVVVDARLELT